MLQPSLHDWFKDTRLECRLSKIIDFCPLFDNEFDMSGNIPDFAECKKDALGSNTDADVVSVLICSKTFCASDSVK